MIQQIQDHFVAPKKLLKAQFLKKQANFPVREDHFGLLLYVLLNKKTSRNKN